MSSFEALLGALARSPDLPLTPPSDVLAAGRRVGRYRVVELLGRGGMGAVYRAHDETLGRDVALKVLLVGPAPSPVDRFRREVVALASVSHENVVAVHDAGLDGALPYMILDLVEGQTLRQRLADGPLPSADVLRLARDLARGLGAAHAVGVVHRDLKPENILLDAGGTAKLVDFGLARLIARDDAPELGATEAGTFLGTAHYMAPEQVRGEAVDARADVFALGAVVYEALAGRRPFDASSRADVISAVLRDEPAPHAPADETSRAVLAVALRCLAKARDRRFQTAAEVLEALESGATVEAARSTEIPETRYASTSGAHIAYQVVSPPGPPPCSRDRCSSRTSK